MRRVFGDIYGNENTKKRLANAVLTDTLAHAFIIDGPDGSGKRTLALEISAALSCENKSNEAHPLPCKRCNTCRRIFEGSYTDVKVLSRQKGKATIGVDAVKDFKEDMFLSSTESEYKIYIIEDAESLTPQSQNALLTVMEEPPSNVVIFLLSASSDKILSTIKSRAQYIAMECFSRDKIEEYLKKHAPSANVLLASGGVALSSVLIKANGSIGKALSLLDPKGAKEAEEEHLLIKRVVGALDSRSSYAVLYTALGDLPESRTELALALESVLSAIGDMIKAKNASSFAPVFFDTYEDAITSANSFSQDRLFKIFELITSFREYITKNAATASVLSALASKIKLL